MSRPHKVGHRTGHGDESVCNLLHLNAISTEVAHVRRTVLRAEDRPHAFFQENDDGHEQFHW